jgi:hypothetical protein
MDKRVSYTCLTNWYSASNLLRSGRFRITKILIYLYSYYFLSTKETLLSPLVNIKMFGWKNDKAAMNAGIN